MKLFQFAYSPYVAKVKKCLQLKGLGYDAVEVPYLDRRELVAATGGWVHVPVLVDGDRVITDSPAITAWLDEKYAPSLRPGALEGPAVVFEQWADHVLEDVAFRLAAPLIEEKIAPMNDGREDARAMWRMVKERKFGPGCVDAWREQSARLAEQAQKLVHPLSTTLAVQPFLLGDQPTVADCAVWGQLYMIEAVREGFVEHLGITISRWYQSLAT